eukprot:TRINITY_DN6275_c0_g1_i3.p1 TRINITY_DN6275_c0_g1~~TRINITY_DN6275_c0_g1_i3.p1  ORF type:complete len:323 (+),score=68.53 TRINITY_DN6275_c0_g1_i3:708-1676(+)
MILVCGGVGSYVLLGTTLDDAIGEAFDKTARLLDLGWEGGGGKALEIAAKNGSLGRVILREPMKGVKNCNFSFSGIKTQISKEIERLKRDSKISQLNEEDISDLAHTFQHVCVQHLITRLHRAVMWCKTNEIYHTISHLVVSGGVASNATIKEHLQKLAQTYGLTLVCPPPNLCTDNGIMIAWAGLENLVGSRCTFSPEEAQPLMYEPRWPLDPSGTDYFPLARKKRKTSMISTTTKATVTKKQEKILLECKNFMEQNYFESKIFANAISVSLTVGDVPRALEICEHGLGLSPDDKILKKLLPQIHSRIQTLEMYGIHESKS